MSFLNSLNGYLDIPNANLRVNGSGQFSSINVGSTRILAGYDLDTVTSVGSITPYTIEFSNATTGIVTTSNGQIGGDLTVLGNAAVSSNLTVAGNATVSSNLTVAGNATVSSNLTVAGNATVSSNLTVAGNATVSSNLTVAGNATVSGDATVSSNLTVAGNTTVSSNLILNEDLFLVGNTQFNVNSKVVTEFTGPHGRPQATLTKFPEIQMTEAAQAGYVVSASSTYNGDTVYPYSPWNVFDGKLTEVSGSHGSWLSASGTYDGNGAPSASPAIETTESSNTWTGEWLQLELPHKIQLTKVEVLRELHAYGEDRSPRSGAILGSNNGTTWSFIHSWANIAEGDFLTAAFKDLGTITTAGHYKYIRFVTTAVQATTQSVKCVSMNEIRFYGTPEVETAGNISQDTTLKSIYNTPSNLDANVYLDGDLGATLTNQISGGPALTGTGATYDSAGKYWSLDGSTESNVVTGDLAFQGDQPHSVSLWFNSSNLEANVANSTIYHIGTEAATGDATHRVYLGNKNLVWNYGKDTDLPLKANTWHHLTHTYEGVGGYRTLYLDGRKVESAYAGDTAGEFPPFDMTGYSQGGYAVSASGENTAQGTAPGRVAYKAFNSLIDDNTGLFQTLVNYASDGSATASAALFEGVRGDWLKLELPTKIKLGHVSVVSSLSTNERIETARIFGSNDDVNWEVIKDTHTLTYVGTVSSYSVNSTKYFKYLLFQILSNFSGPQSQLYKLQYYGHKENDLIRFPDATNVRKYPDTAMTSNGPQRGYTVSTSSEYSDGSVNDYLAWKAFDGTIANDVGAWISDNSPVTYSTSSPFDATAENSLSGITGGVGSRNGAWLKLELPHKIKLNEARLYGRYNANTERIYAGYIYGSNDDTNWTQIGEISVSGISSGNLGTYTEIDPLIITSTDTTNYYKYFIIQPTSLTHANGYAGIGQMEYYGTQESTPVLARLGGAFEGKVANFRVYNKCIKEDQALELWDAQKDQFGLAKSSVTVYNGRVGIGTTEPQAALTVADEVVIPKSGEFPPGAMTNYETHFKDHGLFRASASSEYSTTSFSAWRAFDDNWDNNNDCWASGNATVTAGTGLPSSTAVNFQGTLGNWLQLELPYKIYLNQFKFESRIDGAAPEELPGSGIVYGSNDEVNWDVVHSFSGVNYGGATGTIRPLFTVNSTTSYSIYRLLVTANYLPQTDFTAIGEWRLFGTPETTTKYSTLHDGELTLTKSLNVPRIGPAPDSWFYQVPRRDALEIEFDTSRNIHVPGSGGVVNTAGGNNGPHGSFSYGSKYDSNTRAFAFDEGDDHISLTRTGAQGNFIHSVSVWVNSRDLNDGETILYFGNFTNTSTGQVAACQIYNDRVQSAFWDNTHDFAYTFVNNTWYHIVWTYNGDGSNGRRAYVNGIEIARTATSGAT
jgi:carbonic anhydrase/acetyltransferase-like protein (isoleucine patch superfamily)